MRCFKCGSELPEDSLFCQACGAELRSRGSCAACGAALVEDAVFCSRCGHRRESVPAPKKRRKGVLRPLVLLLPIALLIGALIALLYMLPKSTDAPDETLLTPADAAQSVLYLECYDSTGDLLGTGSGFLIEDGKTLVTNYHVIENVYSMTAYDADGLFAAEISAVLWSSETTDLAVLELDRDTGLIPLTLGDSDLVSQGDAIYAIGYPLGMSNTLSDGIVSSRFTEDTVDILQITAPISPGSSGGALLDPHGQVIGVVYARYEDGQNMNLAVAANELRDLMKRYSIPVRLEELYHQLPPQLSLSDHGAELRYIWAPDEELAYEIQFIWSELETTALALDVLLEEYDGREGCIGHDEPVYLLPGAFSEEFDTWCFDADRRLGDVYLMPEEEGYGLYFFCAAMEGPAEEAPAEEPVPEQAPTDEPPEELPAEEPPSEEAPVCAHIWSIWAIKQPEGCTQEGRMTACCSLCHTSEVRPIPAKGHTAVIDTAAVPATCTEAGSTQSSHCAVCDAVLSSKTVIPAMGHSYEDGACTACGEADPDYVAESLTAADIQGGWTCHMARNDLYASESYTFYNNEYYWSYFRDEYGDREERKQHGTFELVGTTVYFSDGSVGLIDGNYLYVNGLSFYKHPYG